MGRGSGRAALDKARDLPALEGAKKRTDQTAREYPPQRPREPERAGNSIGGDVSNIDRAKRHAELKQSRDTEFSEGVERLNNERLTLFF